MTLEGPRSFAMEQRLYGMNAPTLHHYPHSFSGTYGLAPSFQRQTPFSSMYGTGSLGTSGLAYAHQTTDWGFNHSGTNINASGNIVTSRDTHEYFPSSCQVSLAAPVAGIVKSGASYCDVSAYNSTFSPSNSISPSNTSPHSGNGIGKTGECCYMYKFNVHIAIHRF